MAEPYDWETQDPWLRDGPSSGSNTGILCTGGSMVVEDCVIGDGATVNVYGDDGEGGDDG